MADTTTQPTRALRRPLMTDDALHSSSHDAGRRARRARRPGPDRRPLVSASALMAAGTLLSRVLGFGRLMLLVFLFGNGTRQADMFTIANTVPNSMYILLAGGVLNTVLVPQIVRAIKGDADGGEAYTNRIMTAGLLALAAITVVLTLAVPAVIWLYSADGWRAPGVSAQYDSMVMLAYYCMPQVFFYGVHVLAGQVLNARDRFGPMMWAPIANNVVSIAVLGLFVVVFGARRHRRGVHHRRGAAARPRLHPGHRRPGRGPGAVPAPGRLPVPPALRLPRRRAGQDPPAGQVDAGLRRWSPSWRWSWSPGWPPGATAGGAGGGITAYYNAYAVWILPHSLDHRLAGHGDAARRLPAGRRRRPRRGGRRDGPRRSGWRSRSCCPPSVAFGVLGRPARPARVRLRPGRGGRRRSSAGR